MEGKGEHFQREAVVESPSTSGGPGALEGKPEVHDSNPQKKPRKEAPAIRIDAATTSSPVFRLYPEIWDYILPYLKPSDFHSIINSSPRWRSQFKSEKTDRLLPLWLPIFLKCAGINEISTLLNWRGVSQTAKSIVDNLLEESSSMENYHDNDSPNSSRWTPVVASSEEKLRLTILKIKTCYIFSEEAQIQQFMDQFSSPTSVALARGFLAKSLTLKVGGSVDHSRANQVPNVLIISMLEPRGHLISSISIGWGSVVIDASFLFPILSLLPNLNINLEQLKLVDIRGDDVDWLMWSPLLRCFGRKIEKIICWWSIVTVQTILESIRRGDHPNISSLQVGLIDSSLFDELATLDFPISLKEIDLRERMLETVITFGNVYEGIRRIAGSLVHLKLCFRLDPVEGDIRIETLQPLPTLSMFTTNLSNINEVWLRNFIRLQKDLLKAVAEL